MWLSCPSVRCPLSHGSCALGSRTRPHSPPAPIPLPCSYLAPIPLCHAPWRSSGEEDDEEEDLSNNKIVQFCKSLMSFTDTYDGDKFFTTQVLRGRWLPPLLLLVSVCKLPLPLLLLDWARRRRPAVEQMSGCVAACRPVRLCS